MQATLDARDKAKQQEEEEERKRREWILSQQYESETDSEDEAALFNRDIGYGGKPSNLVKEKEQVKEQQKQDFEYLVSEKLNLATSDEEKRGVVFDALVQLRMEMEEAKESKNAAEKTRLGKLLGSSAKFKTTYKITDSELSEVVAEKQKELSAGKQDEKSDDDSELDLFSTEISSAPQSVKTELYEPTKQERSSFMLDMSIDPKKDGTEIDPRTLLLKLAAKNKAVAGTFKKDSSTNTGRLIYQLTGSKKDDYLVDSNDTSTYNNFLEAQDSLAVFVLFHRGCGYPWYIFMSDVNKEKWLGHHLNKHYEAQNEAMAREFAAILGTAIPVATTTEESKMISDNNKSIEKSDAPQTEAQLQVSKEMASEAKLQKEFDSDPKNKISLPISQVRESLIQQLQEHDFIVVAGATGCGKTTQVPQYLLDAASDDNVGGITNIICTQPRRIAATSVAERVQSERCSSIKKQRVGYHVRFLAKVTKDCRLLFCTTGILLRKLAHNKYLSDVSHVVVDEVHERSVQSDFLLAQLRSISRHRRSNNLRPLKVILMSATVNPIMFSKYCYGCPIVEASGRTFPVQTRYLEDVYEETGYELDPNSQAAVKVAHRYDYDSDEDTGAEETLNPNYDSKLYEDYNKNTNRNLSMLREDVIDFDCVASTVQYIHTTYDVDSDSKGAILVFLSGFSDIDTTQSLLEASKSSKTMRIVCLHSTVPQEHQNLAFKPSPAGIRKVVLATNIAETSITVDDVVYVVDTGRVKQVAFNARTGISSLQETWVSRASSKQRAGRAGRVREGEYFALFTKKRYSDKLSSYTEPEISRVPLTDLCLQAKVIQPDCNPIDSISNVIEPPPEDSVKHAVETLSQIGAFNNNEAMELTVLGSHLANLPVDVTVGKLLLSSVMLDVVSPLLTIAAVLSYKSPYLKGVTPPVADHFSDHLAAAISFREWSSLPRGQRWSYCRKNGLNNNTMDMLADLRQQFALSMMDSNLIGKNFDGKGEAWNRNISKPVVLKAAICYAMQPNVINHSSELKWQLPPHQGGDLVRIHSASVNGGEILQPHPYAVFHTVVKLSSRITVTDCTVVPAAVLLIFSNSLEVSHRKRGVFVNNWIWIDVPAQLAVIAASLRGMIDKQLTSMLSSREPDDFAEQKSELLNPIISFLERNQ
eukprot:TRINITY_DN16225_c0_g1_i1.p1 TRINITY_DN16225_c0_g1~~TRINITY_DN16225_c0_g1_i1.p1  ORF type:complete len:1330 (+),score=351.05 TRINITY_DN16225_c0_g1_i1:530-3991(+)